MSDVLFDICRFVSSKNPRRFKFLSDKTYIRIRYYSSFHKKLSLSHPKTFNEKLQWIKLYDRKPEYERMVDKVEAKEYAASIIGERHIIPTVGVYSSFDEIDFDVLPRQFVMKCTHDSGGLVICRDKSKLEIEEARKKIEQSLKVNYYWSGREWPYKGVKPRILIEQYMEDSCGSGDLSDYKIHCYNGVPKSVQLISNRFGDGGIRHDYYTTDWERLDLRRGNYANADTIAKKPAELPQMLALAAKLSKGIPYIRTDFYIVNHQVYFGELTFFPASGFTAFSPESYDDLFGSWIHLPVDET